MKRLDRRVQMYIETYQMSACVRRSYGHVAATFHVQQRIL